jgi:signal transduction histidine kinase
MSLRDRTARTREAFSRAKDFLRDKELMRYISPVFCAVCCLIMLVRVSREDSPDSEGFVSFLLNDSGIFCIALLMAVSVATLYYRNNNPAIVMLIELMELLFLVFLEDGQRPYIQFPLLIVIYLCIKLPAYPQALCDGIVMIMSVLQLVNRADLFYNFYTICLVLMIIVAGVSSTYNLIHEQHRVAEEIKQAQEHSTVMTRQRDLVLARSRVAAELHDSVGHGLTMIISLSEGLKETEELEENEIAREAIQCINTAARESLAETRQAVKTLNAQDADLPIDIGSTSRYHAWDEIKPVISLIHSTGIRVILTETGKRSQNASHADLCFCITRESITNAMRYARNATLIGVSWDHSETGTAISVRDDGQAGADDHDHNGVPVPGSGLDMLERRIESAGGSLEYGMTPRGWEVKAFVPVERNRSDE